MLATRGLLRTQRASGGSPPPPREPGPALSSHVYHQDSFELPRGFWKTDTLRSSPLCGRIKTWATSAVSVPHLRDALWLQDFLLLLDAVRPSEALTVHGCRKKRGSENFCSVHSPGLKGCLCMLKSLCKQWTLTFIQQKLLPMRQMGGGGGVPGLAERCSSRFPPFLYPISSSISSQNQNPLVKILHPQKYIVF